MGVLPLKGLILVSWSLFPTKWFVIKQGHHVLGLFCLLLLSASLSCFNTARLTQNGLIHYHTSMVPYLLDTKPTPQLSPSLLYPSSSVCGAQLLPHSDYLGPFFPSCRVPSDGSTLHSEFTSLPGQGVRFPLPNPIYTITSKHLQVRCCCAPTQSQEHNRHSANLMKDFLHGSKPE